MSCTDKWAHEALDRLFVGEVEGSDFDRLQKHVKDCPSCSEQYDRITRAQAKLDRAEVLPNERLSLMQGQLMAKLGAAEKKTGGVRVPRVRFWMPALSFGLAAVVAGFVFLTPNKEEFHPRGNAAETAYGVRAFCVATGAQGAPSKVMAEALPGGKLKCPAGSAVQLTYTAPKAAKMKVEVKSKSGEVQPLFPLGGGATDVASGVDVPLGFSTPVTSSWLSEPAKVIATFSDESGKSLAESAIVLEP